MHGNKLNPEHSLRAIKAIKGTTQKVIVMHNPSEIDQNQLLMVDFPKLGTYNFIIPGTTILSFNIELLSTADPKRTLVSKGDCEKVGSQVRRERILHRCDRL